MKIFAYAGAVALIAASPVALAQDKDGVARPQLLTDLVACRAITADAERLACFDRTSGSFAAATESRDLVVLDRAEVKKTKRSLFGFSLPKLPFFDNDDDEDEPEFAEIDTTVTSARGLGYGKWAIRIPEGATWQTTAPMSRDPQSGDAVNIKQGIMGSYIMKVGRARAVKAMRVN